LFAIVDSENSKGRVSTKPGQLQIDVSPDARVVEIIPGDLSLLKPGAAVAVFAAKADDGSLTARGVQVEKDGVKPLM
jgi:hypothetical protein